MCSVSNIPERRKTPPLRGSLVKWEYTNTVSKITLSMCLADAGIVRVTYFPGAVPEDEPSYAVSPGYSAPGAEIREYDEDGVHVVETSLLRIRIRTEEQKVDFYDVATDEPLLTDEGGFGRARTGLETPGYGYGKIFRKRSIFSGLGTSRAP